MSSKRRREECSSSQYTRHDKRSAGDDGDTEQGCMIGLECATITHLGRKETNEDRWTNSQNCGLLGTLFAIYDGHGGSECSEFLAKILHQRVKKSLMFKANRHSKAEMDTEKESLLEQLENTRAEMKQTKAEKREILAIIENGGVSPEDIEALKEPVQQLDELIAMYADNLATLTGQISSKTTISLALRDPSFSTNTIKALQIAFDDTDTQFLKKHPKCVAGSTATVALVMGTGPGNARLVVANAGDSRVILCRSSKALPLSEDHKPNRICEKTRIKEAGGYVVKIAGCYRVTTAAGAGKLDVRRGNCSYLAISRSFGDRGLKFPKKLVTAAPEIRSQELTGDDQFVLLACDGIWDVLSNQDAINIALPLLPDCKKAARAVVKAAFDKRSIDNLTVTVVAFPWANFSPPE